MLLNNPLTETTVQNPRLDYPSMGITELLSEVRLDASKGNELLASKILSAMDNINRQLSGAHYLIAPLDEDKTRFYKRAVANEAAALIAEENKDFDTSSTGQIRGENELNKVASLRRNVNYAIADLTNRKRNRVKLL